MGKSHHQQTTLSNLTLTPHDSFRNCIRFYYRPQRSCGQGNIFTPVCHSVHGGGGVCLSACWHATPPRADNPPTHPRSRPPPGSRHPFPEQTPPGTRRPFPEQTPPGTRRPPDQTLPTSHTPGTKYTTPPREADSRIRSTSGRYASYWNAFLFSVNNFSRTKNLIHVAGCNYL